MKKLSRFEQVIYATDPETRVARGNNDFAFLKLLPREAWAIKLLNIGGCKQPRNKKKFK